jgi:hypothetical protein
MEGGVVPRHACHCFFPKECSEWIAWDSWWICGCKILVPVHMDVTGSQHTWLSLRARARFATPKKEDKTAENIQMKITKWLDEDTYVIPLLESQERIIVCEGNIHSAS